jgi:hypothetical protein
MTAEGVVELSVVGSTLLGQALRQRGWSLLQGPDLVRVSLFPALAGLA